jgi:hypothetical protein
MAETLDKVIRNVLKESGKPLSARQITEIISKRQLWSRPSDGKPPGITQVNARINKYEKYFIRNNGLIVLKSDAGNQDRLCKIVWNSNYWIRPMERSWNPSYADDPNKGYEQKHGFVHEDWLFSPKFVFDGYHYGYIRGIGRLNPDIKIIDTVYLFTINPNTKERYYIGKLHGVEHLQREDIPKSVSKTIRSYEQDMVNELKYYGADYTELKAEPFVPILRFKIESKEIFAEPLLIESSWFDQRYFRTTPMKMTDELSSLLRELKDRLKFNFVASSPDHKVGGYSRHIKEDTTTVDKIHNSIEKALYNYLLKKGIKKTNIACDTTSFGGKLADVVVRLNERTFEIYEIKTDTDIRRGLRHAIGTIA